MNTTPIPQTKEEAILYAIDWQSWASDQNLSYGDLAYWQGIFIELAEKFDLTDVYKENGII